MSSIRNKTVLSAILPAALVFVFTYLIPSGESLHCWVCSSDVDPRCGDPFNMTHFAITDCNRDRMASSYLGSVGTCKKLKQIVGNEVTVIRSCHWDTDRSPSDSCQTTSYAKVEHCSTCSTDTCNAAVRLSSVSVAAALFGCIAIASSSFLQ
uniref:Ly-6/neurotoxin superfamily member 1 n=1 Tax=Nilaparvata lugens TaxID=108931 RepID=C5IWP3_NILLU|nr:Ly-6/neurotoxin superfamily member 1 [Nilaparvata lugens]